ncbi:hypothetical protein AK88_05500 [Plasmodium fragile]|uniref:Uncharacterized protein n=1 Tax=Plasmodium fragile TaxID=5857 RepID=A0A0D9QD14_PLAFR|nr:uncharacterized protein AK88_05500 [Plasmodium fragile]KJP84874.1 hypothetical protein AK88_05500 [Plasmodium fragile]
MKSLKIKGLVKGKNEGYYSLITVISLNDEELDEQIIQKEESVKANLAAIKNAEEISKSEKKLFGAMMRNENVRLRIKGNIKKVTRSRREELSEHYKEEALNAVFGEEVNGDKEYMNKFLNYLQNVQGVKFHGNAVRKGSSRGSGKLEESPFERLNDQSDVAQEDHLLWGGEKGGTEVKCDIHQTNSGPEVKDSGAGPTPLLRVKNKVIQKKKGKKKSMRASQNVTTESLNSSEVSEKTLRKIFNKIKMSLKELKKPKVVIQSPQRVVACRTKQEERHSVIYNMKQGRCVTQQKNNCPTKKSPNYEQYKLYFKGLFQHIRGGKKGSSATTMGGMASPSKGKIMPTEYLAPIGGVRSAEEEDPLPTAREDDIMDITCDDEFVRNKFIMKEMIKDEYRRKRKKGSSFNHHHNDDIFAPNLEAASNAERNMQCAMDETVMSDSDLNDLEYLVSVKGKNANRYKDSLAKRYKDGSGKEAQQKGVAAAKTVLPPSVNFSSLPRKHVVDSPPGGDSSPPEQKEKKENAPMEEKLNDAEEDNSESCIEKSIVVTTRVDGSVKDPTKDNAMDEGSCSYTNNSSHIGDKHMGKNKEHDSPQLNRKKKLAAIMKLSSFILKKRHGRRGSVGDDQREHIVVANKVMDDDAPKEVKTEHEEPKESSSIGDALEGKNIFPPLKAPTLDQINNSPHELVNQDEQPNDVDKDSAPVTETSGLSEEEGGLAFVKNMMEASSMGGTGVVDGMMDSTKGEKEDEEEGKTSTEEDASKLFPNILSKSPSFKRGMSKGDENEAEMDPPSGGEAKGKVQNENEGEATKELLQEEENKVDAEVEKGHSSSSCNSEMKNGGGNKMVASVKVPLKMNTMFMKKALLGKMLAKRFPNGPPSAKGVEVKKGEDVQTGEDNEEGGEASEKNTPMEKTIQKGIPKSKVVIQKMIPPNGFPLKGNAIVKAKAATAVPRGARSADGTSVCLTGAEAEENVVPPQGSEPTVQSMQDVKGTTTDQGVPPKGDNNISDRGFIENAVRKNIQKMLERVDTLVVHARDEKNGMGPGVTIIEGDAPTGFNVEKGTQVKGTEVGKDAGSDAGRDAGSDVPPAEGRKRYSVTLNRFSKKIEVKKRNSMDVVQMFSVMGEKSGEEGCSLPSGNTGEDAVAEDSTGEMQNEVQNGLPCTNDVEKEIPPPSATTADESPKRMPILKLLVKKAGLAKLMLKRPLENIKAVQLGENNGDLGNGDEGGEIQSPQEEEEDQVEEGKDKTDGEQDNKNEGDEKGEVVTDGEETHMEEKREDDPALPKTNVVEGAPLLPPQMENEPAGQVKEGPYKNIFMAKLQSVKHKSTMKQFPLKRVPVKKGSGEEESSPSEGGNSEEETSLAKEQDPQDEAVKDTSPEDTTTKQVDRPHTSENNENEEKDNSDDSDSSGPVSDTKKCPMKKVPPKAMFKILPKIPPKSMVKIWPQIPPKVVVAPFNGVNDSKCMTKVKPPFLNKLKAKAFPPPSMKGEDTEKGLSQEEGHVSP